MGQTLMTIGRRWIGRPGGAGVLVLLAMMVGIAGCEPTTDAAGEAPPPPAVTVITAERLEMTSAVAFNGRIEAVDTVELRARVPGFLEKRLFEEGGDVRQDDVCFVIEKDAYKAAVDAAAADLQKAEARAAEARATAARFEQSVKSGAVSRLQYDESIAQRDVAAAEVLQKQAALERAELDLRYTDVVCAVTGRIGRAAYSVGNYVTPESGTLATVVSQDPMYVTFPISQRYILAVQKDREESGGQPREDLVLRIVLGDGSVYAEPARIDFADIQISESTDTLTIRGAVPNPDRRLIDGQFVTVSVEAAAPTSMLAVPQQALQADQGGIFVLVVNAEDKVEIRRITTGDSRDGMTAVTEGLDEGERVIVEGIQKVRPGQVVEASTAPAAKPDA